MTVRRVGPDDAVELHHYDLGRVLVTIDDLAALMTLLAKPGAPEVKVEFDGGDFTEADELRTLSDLEMRNLRLRTATVQVVLDSSYAFAIGDLKEAQSVYRQWARSRPAPEKPPAIRLSDTRTYIASFMLALIGVLSLVFSEFVLYKASYIGSSGYTLLAYIASLGTLVTGLGFLLLRNQRRHALKSYAVILPVSLSEYRQRLSTEKNPRRSFVVNIIAVIVAAISVAVAIWVKVTSKP